MTEWRTRWRVAPTAGLIVGLAVASPIPTVAQTAAAQQAGKVNRIGYFGGSARIHPAFRQRLRELGYVEGKNLAIEFRPRNRSRPYPVLATELVALNVDLILAVGVGAVSAAKQATRTIPIVMGNSSADPVRAGLVQSLARPGGNVTGVIDLLPELAGKRVELLKEIFPKLSRIAHLAPRANKVGPAHARATKAAARALGIQVLDLTVGSPEDLESSFQAAAAGGAEALIVVGVNFFIPHRKQIVKLEADYRLPTMHTHRRWVRSGGLVAYTTDDRARYRRGAEYVARILTGAKPADLPVEQPTKYLLEINLKTANALGITIPPSLLLRTTTVIQ